MKIIFQMRIVSLLQEHFYQNQKNSSRRPFLIENRSDKKRI